MSKPKSRILHIGRSMKCQYKQSMFLLVVVALLVLLDEPHLLLLLPQLLLHVVVMVMKKKMWKKNRYQPVKDDSLSDVDVRSLRTSHIASSYSCSICSIAYVTRRMNHI